jgi:serine/threonine protein kinase
MDNTDVIDPHGRPVPSAQARPGVDVAESLRDCAFLDCLERWPLGETWKIRTREGHVRVAYYLRAGEGSGLDRLRLLGHPDMPGFEVVESDPGRTVLLTDGFERTLQERFHECWSQGLPGIPREELLGYLRTVAEALDTAMQANGFQHLGLNPGNIWLNQRRSRVGGFGLIQLLWLQTGQPVTKLNPRYSAPELSHARASRKCDQYSLALIFAELLTGVHPLFGPASRRRKGGRSGKDLDVHLLSTADQEIVLRALEPRPSLRFPNASALVKALEEALAAPQVDRNKLPESLPPVIVVDEAAANPPGSAQPGTSLNDFITELVRLAAGPTHATAFHTIRCRLEPGKSLEHRCAVQMFPGAVMLKLEGFRQQWNAHTAELDPSRVTFTVSTPPSFWQRLTGQRLGLEIEVQVVPRPSARSRRTEVAVNIRPFGCNCAQAVRLLEQMGPAVVQSMRSYLQACPEQRTQDRLAISQTLRVSPVLPGMQLAEPIVCVAKDISPTGIGFFLPHPPCTSQVYINLPEMPNLAPVAGLATIVRGQQRADGWYEVGASFAVDDKTKPQ